MKDKNQAESANARLRPIVVIKQNKFYRNSAYSSGNAIYLRGTRPRETEENERTMTCGGFLIQGNEFTNNTAVTKSHNGGAITLACDHVNAKDTRYIGRTSEVAVSEANRTMQISYYLTKE
jgi:hypothetical protein